MDKQRHAGDNALSDGDLANASGDAPVGVRRVNNVPLLIIGGVLAAFVALVALVALKKDGQGAAAKEPAAAADALPENSQLIEQMLANNAMGGLVPDAEERVPSFPVMRVEDPELPPMPASAAPGPAPSEERSDAMAEERMKRFQSAMQAKTAVAKAAVAGESRADNEKDEDGEAGNKAGPTIPSIGQRAAPIVADGNYSRFDHKPGKARSDRWLLGAGVEEPRTAYEIRTGAVIPATMISGINSDIPGQIVAQVSQDVFDTPTGRHRLIPQGSRLVGRYDNNVVMGQSRLLVAWQRIVFPDGRALDIGAMEGADSAGYAGFGDKVDRHYLRLFGSAMLMSMVTSGLTSSRISPENDPFGSSNQARLSQTMAQQLGEVATKMIEQNMNIAPTLEIRPGYRFNVMVVKDLTLERPYRAFDY